MNEACLADRVIVLNEGEIVLDGSPRYVYDRSEIIKNAGLELPQIAQLMQALGKPVAFDVEEAVETLCLN
jgi:energy-coupling factor transport system ATP-binding protein